MAIADYSLSFTISQGISRFSRISECYCEGTLIELVIYRTLLNDPLFIQYLQEDLGLSDSALAVATRQRQPTKTELPIVLWNYGLISLEQLGQIFDWMEMAAV